MDATANLLPGQSPSASGNRQQRLQAKQAELNASHGSLDNWIDNVPDAPVFKPTAAEFADPMAYISKIQYEAAEWGICKIVPPVSAAVPGTTVLLQKGPYTFTTRMQQLRRPEPSALDSPNSYGYGKEYSIVSYERAANEFAYKRYNMASGLPARFVEAEYWREWNGSGPAVRVEYGNDVEGTAFSGHSWDPLSASPWACSALPKAKHSSLRLLPVEIPGITTPMMYIGMLFTTFAWHVEDLYLYSINFHHFGAPKTWYGVPASDADGFEQVALSACSTPPDTADGGIAARKTVKILMGKTAMFPPKLLSLAGVRVCRCVQQPGEFVVTFPRAYHAGFSHGYNCGEAVNFGTPDWLPCGLAANVRYGMLRHVPLLSVEALLCLEASELAQSSQDDADLCEVQRRWQRTIKNTFVGLIVWQNKARHRLASAGAKCHVISNALTPLLRCVSCQQLCYLAAAISSPQSVANSKGTMCLRCAVEQLESSGDNPVHATKIICHPDLSDHEGMAKFWQSEAVRAENNGHAADLEDACHSRFTQEPSWRSTSAQGGHLHGSQKYEWADVPLTTVDICLPEWNWLADIVSAPVSASSSGDPGKVPVARCRGKRTSNSQTGSRRQKFNRPLSWSAALKMGQTGTATNVSESSPIGSHHPRQACEISIALPAEPLTIISQDPCACSPAGVLAGMDKCPHAAQSSPCALETPCHSREPIKSGRSPQTCPPISRTKASLRSCQHPAPLSEGLEAHSIAATGRLPYDAPRSPKTEIHTETSEGRAAWH